MIISTCLQLFRSKNLDTRLNPIEKHEIVNQTSESIDEDNINFVITDPIIEIKDNSLNNQRNKIKSMFNNICSVAFLLTNAIVQANAQSLPNNTTEQNNNELLYNSTVLGLVAGGCIAGTLFLVCIFKYRKRIKPSCISILNQIFRCKTYSPNSTTKNANIALNARQESIWITYTNPSNNIDQLFDIKVY